MASVTESHSVSLETSGETENLVTHADTEDGFVPLVDGDSDSLDGLHDAHGASGSVGQEKTVVLVSDRVEVKVPGEDGDDGVSLDEGSEDVGLGSKVEDGNLGSLALGVQGVRLWGGDLGDEVLLGRVPVLGGRAGEDIVPDGELTEGGSLVSQQRRDGSSVDTRDTGDVVSGTPLVEGLDGLIVRVLESDVRDDDTGALDTVRLEEGDTGGLWQRGVGGDTVVSDHGRSEDEDLTKVRRVGHRVGVRGDRGAKDRLTKLRVGRSKGLSIVGLSRLEEESSGALGREDVGEETGVLNGRSESPGQLGRRGLEGRSRRSNDSVQHVGVWSWVGVFWKNLFCLMIEKRVIRQLVACSETRGE